MICLRKCFTEWESEKIVNGILCRSASLYVYNEKQILLHEHNSFFLLSSPSLFNPPPIFESSFHHLLSLIPFLPPLESCTSCASERDGILFNIYAYNVAIYSDSMIYSNLTCFYRMKFILHKNCVCVCVCVWGRLVEFLTCNVFPSYVWFIHSTHTIHNQPPSLS